MLPMQSTIAPRTGLTLKNPVIAASGTFGYGIEFAIRSDVSGLGAIICKGTTREPRPGNEPIRLTESPAGMLNSIGLQNVGVDAVIADKAPIWTTWAVPVLVNVSATCVEDYRHVVSRLDGVPGVAGIELNISCPNVRAGGVQFGTEPTAAAEVTAATRSATRLPLVVKLSPNVADIRSIAAAVEEAGADAVSLINTVYGMAVDSGRRTPILSTGSGGLSGPAIKPIALHLVYQVAQEVSIPVIGIGGILTAADAVEYLLVGATAVELGTALLLDPACWRDVVAGIEDWCRREDIRSLDQVVGSANPGFKAKRKTGAAYPLGNVAGS
jgi:dihydroorotate dehydrogenase (NAD+) catalytic subunit